MYVLLTTGHFDRRVVKVARAHTELKKPLAKVPVRIIHEGFYYNRRYAAATSLTAGGLAAQSVNILCKVCFSPSRLRAPVSRDVSAVSSRILVSNEG